MCSQTRVVSVNNCLFERKEERETCPTDRACDTYLSTHTNKITLCPEINKPEVNRTENVFLFYFFFLELTKKGFFPTYQKKIINQFYYSLSIVLKTVLVRYIKPLKQHNTIVYLK